jgi:peroxin-19
MPAPPNQNKPSLHSKKTNPGSDDDEDLDDLDEVLDQFSPARATSTIPTSTSKSSISTSTSTSIPRAPPPTATIPASDDSEAQDDNDDDLTSAFTRELQRGMESLMREMVAVDPSLQQAASGAGVTGTKSKSPGELAKDQERAFKAAWEALLVQGMDGTENAGGVVGEEFTPALSSSRRDGEGEGRPDFQSGIRATVNKLKSSESGFKSSSSTSPPSGETPPINPLAAFLSQLNDLDVPSSGSGNDDDDEPANEKEEEELRGMLELMMDSLMSKEVLYEPLKELGEKYPSYLHQNAASLSPDEKANYETQLGYITRILAIFEDPKYAEEEKEKGREVVELMGLMQTCGSPPAELMGDLPPGFVSGPDGMPQMPEGCCIS